jgi:UDP-N-acetylglucosamine 2-epimerase
VVEAMSIPVPVVNVGDRQRGREGMGFLLSVGYDRAEIRRAVETALHDAGYRAELRRFHQERWAAVDTEAAVVECLLSLDPEAGRRPKGFHDLSAGAPEAALAASPA